LGFHHSVVAGLVKHGAKVWRQALHEKKPQPFSDWFSEFVLLPFWSKTQRWISQSATRSSSSFRGRVVPVFFCKWGRHRSVAMHDLFLPLLGAFEWVSLDETSHLASQSWQFTTCNYCEDCKLASMKPEYQTAVDKIFEAAYDAGILKLS